MAKNKGGRPTKYSQALATSICEALMNSTRGLRTICADNEISPSMLFRWLIDKDEFREQYEYAQEVRREMMAEDILEVSDESSRDIYEGKDGRERTDHEAIQRSKLKVETRKWIAERLLPKKYGNKQEIDHTVELITKIERSIVSSDNTDA